MSGLKNCEHQNGVVEFITQTLTQTIQGGPFDFQFAVYTKMKKKLQQTRANFQENFNAKKLFIAGWATFFILVLKMGRNSKKRITCIKNLFDNIDLWALAQGTQKTN